MLNNHQVVTKSIIAEFFCLLFVIISLLAYLADLKIAMFVAAAYSVSNFLKAVYFAWKEKHISWN